MSVETAFSRSRFVAAIILTLTQTGPCRACKFHSVWRAALRLKLRRHVAYRRGKACRRLQLESAFFLRRARERPFFKAEGCSPWVFRDAAQFIATNGPWRGLLACSILAAIRAVPLTQEEPGHVMGRPCDGLEDGLHGLLFPMKAEPVPRTPEPSSMAATFSLGSGLYCPVDYISAERSMA